MSIFSILKPKINTDYDISWCNKCGWKGSVQELDIEYEQESWEMPEYKIYFCPKCGADIIDEFDYSKQKYEYLKNLGYNGYDYGYGYDFDEKDTK